MNPYDENLGLRHMLFSSSLFNSEELDLSSFDLNGFDFSILTSNKSIKRLNLSNCNLTEIPKEISWLPNLTEINLWGNPLKESHQNLLYERVEVIKGALDKEGGSGEIDDDLITEIRQILKRENQSQISSESIRAHSYISFAEATSQHSQQAKEVILVKFQPALPVRPTSQSYSGIESIFAYMIITFIYLEYRFRKLFRRKPIKNELPNRYSQTRTVTFGEIRDYTMVSNNRTESTKTNAKLETRKLVETSRTEDAIVYVQNYVGKFHLENKNLIDSALLLKSRFNTIQYNRIQGTLTLEEYNSKINNLNKSILQTLDFF